MDVFPKFIIETDDVEGDVIILAKCTYHKQLATDIKKVKGGGWWTLDREAGVFTLQGRSDDFGPASLEDIKNVVERGKVFSNASLYANLCEKYEFRYLQSDGEIIELKNLTKNV